MIASLLLFSVSAVPVTYNRGETSCAFPHLPKRRWQNGRNSKPLHFMLHIRRPRHVIQLDARVRGHDLDLAKSIRSTRFNLGEQNTHALLDELEVLTANPDSPCAS